jgi:hypothetical protein
MNFHTVTVASLDVVDSSSICIELRDKLDDAAVKINLQPTSEP